MVSRSLLLAATCFVLLLAGSLAQAIVTDQYSIKLPRGSLHAALISLGQQTQTSIIFPSSLPDDQDAPELVGNFSILQILEQLVENREIEFRVVGPLTVVVLPRCSAGWDCSAMHEDLERSKQQYPMIE